MSNAEYITIDACDTKHKETLAILTEINNRLYKDNGKKSIQSKLNEQETIIQSIVDNQKRFDGALTRLFWTIATPLIGGTLWVCFVGIKYLITTGEL